VEILALKKGEGSLTSRYLPGRGGGGEGGEKRKTSWHHVFIDHQEKGKIRFLILWRGREKTPSDLGEKRCLTVHDITSGEGGKRAVPTLTSKRGAMIFFSVPKGKKTGRGRLKGKGAGSLLKRKKEAHRDRKKKRHRPNLAVRGEGGKKEKRKVQNDDDYGESLYLYQGQEKRKGAFWLPSPSSSTKRK